MLRLSLSLACLSLLATACASTHEIYVNRDPAADFAGYHTYAFQAPLDTDREDGTQSILSSFLKIAIARELDARGYRQADNPDLRVNTHVETTEKLSVYEVPSSPYGYYGYRLNHYGTWSGYGYAYETHVDEYTEGTLTIDLVEVGRNQLVWEGTIVGRVTQKARENMEDSVNRAVTDLFERYPVGIAEVPAR